jgi:hypothetical protein
MDAPGVLERLMTNFAFRARQFLPTRWSGKSCGPAGHEQTMTRHPVAQPTTEVVAPGSGPAADVETWRLRRLVDAGFPIPLALELATTPGTDLHALLALVDRGCPPELAARILAPVDDAAGRP